MNQPENVPERLQELLDDYLDGRLDEAGVQELEALLRADAEARRHFVRYACLHTDLHLEVRGRLAGARVLDRIEQLVANPGVPPTAAAAGSVPGEPARPRLPGSRWYPLIAAGLLLAAGLGWWLAAGRPGGRAQDVPGTAVAWLVNAQNCQWADAVGPTGVLSAGKVLQVERGLVEVRFHCGASVVLQGPARLQLLSGKGARLLRGKLSARVPQAAAGFEILSPQGKVIDLGTEFGVTVADNGVTDVYVFEGKVEAYPRRGGQPEARPVHLTRNQAARLSDDGVSMRPAQPAADQFVRAIVPPPVVIPRTLGLKFKQAVRGSLCDAAGAGTGLTHRLPGTGHRLREADRNLHLDTARGRLELTTTDSDLNTQYKLHQGEYLGVRLSDLGFTGKEDFAVTATVLDIPALEFIGQFGLYAGSGSNCNIRGGLLSRKRAEAGEYTQFLVNNRDGRDDDIGKVGLLSTRTNLRLTLKRTGGKYALTVDNLTEASSSTLTIRHPEFLDDEPDLYVGLFGANTQSKVRRVLVFSEFEVTVWTKSAPAVPALVP
jgi:hypothetical protein